MRSTTPGYPRVEIALSTRKLMLLLGYNALLLTLSGLVLGVSPRFPLPVNWLMIISGTVAALFFGGSLVVYSTKLFQRKPGFVVDHEGLIDQADAGSCGRVYWSEIQGLRLGGRTGQGLVLLQPGHPNTIIPDAGPVTQLFLRFNQWRFGTPLVLSTTTLEIDPPKLFQLIKENHTALSPEPE